MPCCVWVCVMVCVWVHVPECVFECVCVCVCVYVCHIVYVVHVLWCVCHGVCVMHMPWCVCVGVCSGVCVVHVPWCVCGGERTTLWNQLFSSTFTRIPGIKLRLSRMYHWAATADIHRIISLAHYLISPYLQTCVYAASAVCFCFFTVCLSLS